MCYSRQNIKENKDFLVFSGLDDRAKHLLKKADEFTTLPFNIFKPYLKFQSFIKLRVLEVPFGFENIILLSDLEAIEFMCRLFTTL